MSYAKRRMREDTEMLFRGVIVATDPATGNGWTMYLGPYTAANQARGIITRRMKWNSPLLRYDTYVESCTPRWERFYD